MPRFLSAESIPMAKRKGHIERYRSQLRDALLNPALTEEQRNAIKDRLRRLGKPRVYGVAAEEPPTTPQIEVPEPAPVETIEDLLAKSKADLRIIAEQEGVAVYKSWSISKLAHAIFDHRIERQP